MIGEQRKNIGSLTFKEYMKKWGIPENAKIVTVYTSRDKHGGYDKIVWKYPSRGTR